MSEMVIPLLAALVVLVGLVKGVPVYDAFVKGAKAGFHSALGILPNLAAMLMAVNLMRASGLLLKLESFFIPFLEVVGIPSEAAPLMLMRPFTGSGALAMLQSIFETAGPDSRAGLVASTLMGASETIFYTLGIYMSAAHMKRCGYVLPAALAAWLAGSITAGLFYR